MMSGGHGFRTVNSHTHTHTNEEGRCAAARLAAPRVTAGDEPGTVTWCTAEGGAEARGDTATWCTAEGGAGARGTATWCTAEGGAEAKGDTATWCAAAILAAARRVTTGDEPGTVAWCTAEGARGTVTSGAAGDSSAA